MEEIGPTCQETSLDSQTLVWLRETIKREQARSPDFLKEGYVDALMCTYICVYKTNKQARLVGSGGMLPQENV